MSEQEPTRRELTEALEKERAENRSIQERLAKLESAFAGQPSEGDLRKTQTESLLAAALEELRTLRPSAGLPLGRPSGPAPKAVAYRGLARAKEKCALDALHEAGEVFQVEVPALWSDDPFEPVREGPPKEDGSPTYLLRTDVVVIDYRFRPRVGALDPVARAV